MLINNGIKTIRSRIVNFVKSILLPTTQQITRTVRIFDGVSQTTTLAYTAGDVITLDVFPYVSNAGLPTGCPALTANKLERVSFTATDSGVIGKNGTTYFYGVLFRVQINNDVYPMTSAKGYELAKGASLGAELFNKNQLSDWTEARSSSTLSYSDGIVADADGTATFGAVTQLSGFTDGKKYTVECSFVSQASLLGNVYIRVSNSDVTMKDNLLVNNKISTPNTSTNILDIFTAQGSTSYFGFVQAGHSADAVTRLYGVSIKQLPTKHFQYVNSPAAITLTQDSVNGEWSSTGGQLFQLSTFMQAKFKEEQLMAKWEAEKHHPRYFFEGDGATRYIPLPSAIMLTGDFEIEFYANVIPTINNKLIGTDTYSKSGLLGWDTNGNIVIRTSGNWVVIGNKTIDSKRHKFGVVRASNILSVFIDNLLVGTTGFSLVWDIDFIGRAYGSSAYEYFNGTISNIKIHDRGTLVYASRLNRNDGLAINEIGLGDDIWNKTSSFPLNTSTTVATVVTGERYLVKATGGTANLKVYGTSGWAALTPDKEVLITAFGTALEVKNFSDSPTATLSIRKAPLSAAIVNPEVSPQLYNRISGTYNGWTGKELWRDATVSVPANTPDSTILVGGGAYFNSGDIGKRVYVSVAKTVANDMRIAIGSANNALSEGNPRPYTVDTRTGKILNVDAVDTLGTLTISAKRFIEEV